jgi:phosphoglycerate dehydrogenase-like enzyme
MINQALTVFCNQKFPDETANAALVEGVEKAGHRLVYSKAITTSNLSAAAGDPAIGEADVAFGQPDPQAVIASPRLKWVHLTSAGWDRYDREDLRAALRGRGGMLSNSSWVYEEPCAEHVFAMMLAQARRLDWALANQAGEKEWPAAAIRRSSRLLSHQTVVLLSFGTIARRLVELLRPFDMTIIAVRRNPTGKEPVTTIPESQVDSALILADHVVNILPGGDATRGFVSAARFELMRPSCAFYNIGRGTTVDQEALLKALKSGRLGAAWLDVTDPEPLPPSHPLWTAPHCQITPHTAGGHVDEFNRLVFHFLRNLERFVKAEALRDRVV